MKSVLFIAVVLLVGLQVILGQDCSTYTTCQQCTENGCNYCQSYSSGTSGCYSADLSAAEANCNNQGVDQQDEYILSDEGEKCYGGCANIEYCDSCVALAGCGYCHRGQQGCKSSRPGDCDVWLTDSCRLPCDARDSCQLCLDGDYQDGESCTWTVENPENPNVGTCQNGGQGEDIISDLGACPDPVPTNTAGTLSVMMFLIAASVAALM